MNQLPVTVYSPESSLASPVKMLRDMFRDLASGRELAFRLAVRDIKAQYRQAFLGILWAFVLPLANTVTWLFLSKSGIVQVSDTGLPYSLYVFTGTMLWAIFMDALNAPMQQVNNAKSMLSKLNFPREALIVSGVYQTLFNASIKVVLMLMALLLMGIQPGWGLLLVPLGVLSLVLVGSTLGILITPVGLLYGDIGRALPLLMQFFMYLTPVVFPMPKDGIAGTLFQLNPLTPLIVTCRDWLTGQDPTMLASFLVVNALAACLLLIVWAIYRLAMPILIERMGGQAMSETLVKVENVSKKFCRSLKRSLWYGMQDLGREMTGHRHGGNGKLRPEEFWAVKDVSFELKRGECLGE